MLSQPGALQRPRLLDVNPIDASVRQALYVWLGALRGRRSRGAVAPCTGVANCAVVTITWKAPSAKVTATASRYITTVVIQ